MLFFSCAINQGFKYTFNLCITTITTHPRDPFPTFFTYFVLFLKNGMPEKLKTVIDINFMCIICL